MFLETQQNTAKDLTPMPDQFEHYITKNIKSFYKRRLLTPILYLIFLLVLWFVLSLSAPLFPDTLDAPDKMCIRDRLQGMRAMPLSAVMRCSG